MSSWEKIQASLLNWNEEEFKKLDGTEFMRIRENECKTRDDWIANMNEF